MATKQLEQAPRAASSGRRQKIEGEVPGKLNIMANVHHKGKSGILVELAVAGTRLFMFLQRGGRDKVMRGCWAGRAVACFCESATASLGGAPSLVRLTRNIGPKIEPSQSHEASARSLLPLEQKPCAQGLC